MQNSRNTRVAGLLRCTIVALGYFVTGKLGLSMPYRISVVTLLWLPMGIAVPAVFRWGRAMLVAVFIGTFVLSLVNHQGPWLALGIGATNTAGAASIALILGKLGFNPQFQRRRDVIIWCAGCVAGSLIAPCLGPTVLCLGGAIPWSAWRPVWLMWWLGDLIGLLLVGPVLMAATAEQFRRLGRSRTEVALLVALSGAASWVAFFRHWSTEFLILQPVLLVFPLQIWAALRFGVLGASIQALGVSVLAALATSFGMGPFAGLNPVIAVFSFWAFAGMAALLSLLITALEAERDESARGMASREAELRTLTDNLPDMVVRLDATRLMVFTNRAVELETGFPTKHFFKKTMSEAGFSYGSFAEWTAKIDRVFSTGESEHLDFSLNGPNGIRQWSAQIVPEFGEGGRVLSVLIICRDTTDHRRLESQLRQSQKLEAVGTLAGGIAHDFNNILTGIFGNTQMAMMDLPEDHPVSEWLRRVFQASQRAKDLVNRILAFSRQQEQKKAPQSVPTIVREALQLLRPSIPSLIEINARLPEDVPPVMADSSQLHQVIVNLVTNAAYAIGDSKGTIDISVDEIVVDGEAVRQRPQLRLGRFVRLAVGDTGIGMDAATQSRIFEPFFTTKERGSGTGLGLSVVHGIVAQHDGAIVVYSEPGRGSTFMVYLPVHGSTPMPTESGSAGTGIARGTGERILVIDDEEPVLHVAKSVLQRLGYVPETHADPEAGLAAFSANPSSYAVVLTDLTMPKMKGVEVVGRVRATRPGIPVILCTGFQGSLASSEAKRLGIDEILLKPFTVEMIGKSVARALAASQRRSG